MKRDGFPDLGYFHSLVILSGRLESNDLTAIDFSQTLNTYV